MLCLDKQYPFLMKYFKNGILNKNIAHCLLFYGSDLSAQYDLALEIARLLNCKGTKSEDCECLNCNWIRENKHPAVMTVSRIDNKPSDDNSKTVISIEQARMIKNDLLVTSDYHRVIIFCDKDKDGNIAGLNNQNFQEEASNALLKTFEEPPSNTTFIFLTKDKTDVISTVVSRSQTFFVPAATSYDKSYNLVEDLVSDYWLMQKNEVLDFENRLYTLASENGAVEVFRQIQNYILYIMMSNFDNKVLFYKLLRDIEQVEIAKRQCELSPAMNLSAVCENLSFKLFL